MTWLRCTISFSTVSVAAIGCVTLLASPAIAADLTARQVTELLFKTKEQGTVDLSGKDLSFLDLSGIDFKRASFAKSNLHGVVFTDSNLSGANLKGALLNLATVTRTDFTGADLEGASLLRVGFTASLEPRPKETPIFRKANLKGARLHSRLDYTDFSEADLSGAQFGPEDPKNELLLTARPVFNGAIFARTKLRDAVMRMTKLRFANFAGADLSRADFTGSDLSRADFTGADVSNVNFTDAVLYGANFSGVRGLETAKGLDKAIDYDKAMR